MVNQRQFGKLLENHCVTLCAGQGNMSACGCESGANTQQEWRGKTPGWGSLFGQVGNKTFLGIKEQKKESCEANVAHDCGNCVRVCLNV